MASESTAKVVEKKASSAVPKDRRYVGSKETFAYILDDIAQSFNIGKYDDVFKMNILKIDLVLQSVTNGIISALDRKVIVEGHRMTLLQTNAAINPGNSGGGLFNMAGELIGIVNAKQSETGIEGLGFAIPIDVAYAAAKDLINYGYVMGKLKLDFEIAEKRLDEALDK